VEFAALPPEPFAGAEEIESVKVVSATLPPSLLRSIPGVRSLELVSWDDDWQTGAFTQLPKLERLATQFCPPAALLEGCRLLHFETGRSAKADLREVLAVLETLRTFSLLGEHTPLASLLELVELGRARRFERLGLGIAHLERPFTGAGVLDVPFSFVTLPKVVELLKALPADAASRVVVRPFNQHVAARVTPEQREELRSATSLPLELQPYA
jgi:hypothetical protein